MSGSNPNAQKDVQWLDELRALGNDLYDAQNETALEIRYKTALQNLETYQEELRAQNEELNLARENSEDALKRYQFLFENSPMGYFTIDERRSIESVNYTGVNMLGLDRIHLIDKPFFLFVAPDSRNTLDSHFRAVFAGHRPSDEIYVLHSKGESFPVIIESCLAQTETRTDKRCLTIIFDNTERKKSESDLLLANQNLEASRLEAEQASRAKSNFIAVMSHELRTPLNAILGFSEIIKDDMVCTCDVKKYSEYGNDIFDSGQHLLTLVNDILDISKIESGAVTIKPEHQDVPGIFDECASIYNPKAEEKGVSLRFEVSNDLPALFADRRAVLQMMFNLISNSIRHTPTSGEIAVRAEVMSDVDLIISVADTGAGIEAERIQDITKPFGRTDNPHVPRMNGTGLGLPITEGLIKQHGGDIRIMSEMNKGTTVSLSFPLERN